MGKIIKFDPERRRKRTRDWTRPEDYGASSAPRSAPASAAHRRAERADDRAGWPPGDARPRWPARLAVGGIILAAVAASLLGLD